MEISSPKLKKLLLFQRELAKFKKKTSYISFYLFTDKLLDIFTYIEKVYINI